MYCDFVSYGRDSREAGVNARCWHSCVTYRRGTSHHSCAPRFRIVVGKQEQFAFWGKLFGSTIRALSFASDLFPPSQQHNLCSRPPFRFMWEATAIVNATVMSPFRVNPPSLQHEQCQNMRTSLTNHAAIYHLTPRHHPSPASLHACFGCPIDLYRCDAHPDGFRAYEGIVTGC